MMVTQSSRTSLPAAQSIDIKQLACSCAHLSLRTLVHLRRKRHHLMARLRARRAIVRWIDRWRARRGRVITGTKPISGRKTKGRYLDAGSIRCA